MYIELVHFRCLFFLPIETNLSKLHNFSRFNHQRRKMNYQAKTWSLYLHQMMIFIVLIKSANAFISPSFPPSSSFSSFSTPMTMKLSNEKNTNFNFNNKLTVSLCSFRKIKILTFRELESLTCFLLTEFLTLNHSRVPC